MLSYWERKEWFTNVDFTIVGSGIVGLNCALKLRELHPESKILILERGRLPHGASTKNAGFACFGSISEMLDDLNHMSEDELYRLVHRRITGLQMLRTTLGDGSIGYQQLGGYEIFQDSDGDLYETCTNEISRINQLLFPIFRQEIFSMIEPCFGMKHIKNKKIYNALEGQIDTGKMMTALLLKAHIAGIKILNNTELDHYSEAKGGVQLYGKDFDFVTSNLLIATNGFAPHLLDIKMQPARAQVLITEPIQNLSIKGTFHLDRGYYYFRNIDDRILLGGGRNLDIQGETTVEIDLNHKIQNQLSTILNTIIFPDRSVKVERRWAGIMGVGSDKNPIIKQVSDRIYCGVKMGGMGIAIGSLVGQELAELCE